MSDTPVSYDLDGESVISKAILSLLNQFPKLGSETFLYATLSEDGGKAIFPTGGSAIQREIKDILGHTVQMCVYPIMVVYRVGGLTDRNKLNVKEWLDDLGRWLEKQPLTVGTATYQISDYPELTGNRIIRKIARQSASYLNGINYNNTEDWTITINVTYTNEF